MSNESEKGKNSGCIGYLCLVVLVIFVLNLMKSCCHTLFHEHEWLEATCTEPKTCASCGETEGEALGHDWDEATCIKRKTCRRCGETDGGYGAHNWMPATCTEPETCSLCGKHPLLSVALGHDWQSATCTTPKTCSRCGETEGTPIQHEFDKGTWKVVKEATCQSEGEMTNVCIVCGTVVNRTIEKTDHEAGDWQVVTKATSSKAGEKVKYCTVCGTEIERKEYTEVQSTSNSAKSSGGNGSNFNTYNNKSQQETSAKYVINTSTLVFHRPTCRDVKKIAPKNYSTSNKSRDELAKSYKACGHCHP